MEDTTLNEMATSWWSKIIQVNIKDIGGLYHKIIIQKSNLSDQVYSDFSYIDQNILNQSVKKLKAKSSTKTSKQLLESITARSPLMLVDRHDTLGKCLSFLTFGKYRRYAWINPLQIVIMSIIQNAEAFSEEDIFISATVVRKKEVTNDFIVGIEKNFHQYIHAGN